MTADPTRSAEDLLYTVASAVPSVESVRTVVPAAVREAVPASAAVQAVQADRAVLPKAEADQAEAMLPL